MNAQGGGIIGSLAAVAGTEPTITVYDHSGTSLGSAWVVPLLEGISATPQVEATGRLLNYQGDIVAVHWAGEYYEATFRVKPFGTSLANAVKSAHMLRFGFTIVTAGFPVIVGSPFTDLLNVTTGDPGGNRWIFEGGSLELSNNSPAGRSITLRRYPKIVGGTAITS